MTATSIDFADLVRWAGQHARTAGLTVPSFRSPPTHPSANRSAVWHADDTVTVRIRVRGRTVLDVALDIVAGIALANDIAPGHPDIGTLRARLIDTAGLADDARAAAG